METRTRDRCGVTRDVVKRGDVFSNISNNFYGGASRPKSVALEVKKATLRSDDSENRDPQRSNSVTSGIKRTQNVTLKSKNVASTSQNITPRTNSVSSSSDDVTVQSETIPPKSKSITLRDGDAASTSSITCDSRSKIEVNGRVVDLRCVVVIRCRKCPLCPFLATHDEIIDQHRAEVHAEQGPHHDQDVVLDDDEVEASPATDCGSEEVEEASMGSKPGLQATADGPLDNQVTDLDRLGNDVIYLDECESNGASSEDDDIEVVYSNMPERVISSKPSSHKLIEKMAKELSSEENDDGLQIQEHPSLSFESSTRSPVPANKKQLSAGSRSSPSPRQAQLRGSIILRGFGCKCCDFAATQSDLLEAHMEMEHGEVFPEATTTGEREAIKEKEKIRSSDEEEIKVRQPRKRKLDFDFAEGEEVRKRREKERAEERISDSEEDDNGNETTNECLPQWQENEEEGCGQVEVSLLASGGNQDEFECPDASPTDDHCDEEPLVEHEIIEDEKSEDESETQREVTPKLGGNDKTNRVKETGTEVPIDGTSKMFEDPQPDNQPENLNRTPDEENSSRFGPEEATSSGELNVETSIHDKCGSLTTTANEDESLGLEPEQDKSSCELSVETTEAPSEATSRRQHENPIDYDQHETPETTSDEGIPSECEEDINSAKLIDKMNTNCPKDSLGDSNIKMLIVEPGNPQTATDDKISQKGPEEVTVIITSNLNNETSINFRTDAQSEASSKDLEESTPDDKLGCSPKPGDMIFGAENNEVAYGSATSETSTHCHPEDKADTLEILPESTDQGKDKNYAACSGSLLVEDSSEDLGQHGDQPSELADTRLSLNDPTPTEPSEDVPGSGRGQEDEPTDPWGAENDVDNNVEEASDAVPEESTVLDEVQSVTDPEVVVTYQSPTSGSGQAKRSNSAHPDPKVIDAMIMDSIMLNNDADTSAESFQPPESPGTDQPPGSAEPSGSASPTGSSRASGLVVSTYQASTSASNGSPESNEVDKNGEASGSRSSCLTPAARISSSRPTGSRKKRKLSPETKLQISIYDGYLSAQQSSPMIKVTVDDDDDDDDANDVNDGRSPGLFGSSKKRKRRINPESTSGVDSYLPFTSKKRRINLATKFRF